MHRFYENKDLIEFLFLKFRFLSFVSKKFLVKLLIGLIDMYNQCALNVFFLYKKKCANFVKEITLRTVNIILGKEINSL